MPRKTYPATSPRQVETILDIYSRALLGKLLAQEMTKLAPLASIISIEEREDAAVAVKLTDRSPRIMDDVAGLLLCAFAIYKTASSFNPDRKIAKNGQKDYMYCPNYKALKVGFPRVMAGARAGEQVRLSTDHRDLRPIAGLHLRGMPRYGMGDSFDARSKALDIALANYDQHAKALGLADLMSRDEYRELILGLYRLCDARFGHILRPLPAVAA